VITTLQAIAFPRRGRGRLHVAAPWPLAMAERFPFTQAWIPGLGLCGADVIVRIEPNDARPNSRLCQRCAAMATNLSGLS
jgi:hypothetical protein